MHQQSSLYPFPKFTDQEILELRKSAKQDIPDRVDYFSSLLGVTYSKISFGFQKSRWGSCSSSGNLRFNCLLMCTPPEIRDYVVVHELCHRKFMNHSSSFWREVQKTYPNYAEAKRWLKENGKNIISRLQ